LTPACNGVIGKQNYGKAGSSEVPGWEGFYFTIKYWVRPLNLIRIMLVEENCSWHAALHWAVFLSRNGPHLKNPHKFSIWTCPACDVAFKNLFCRKGYASNHGFS